ncbi:MAG: glutamate ABC transporter substrate-binding protein [Pseudonocardiaceae bacterium]|nr:glutamate ABC transporter substrate-binding protein [Pseudonocardiaceae bacterium]
MSTRFVCACAVSVMVLAGMAGEQWPDHLTPKPALAGSWPTTVMGPAAARSPAQASAEPGCNPQNVRASLRPQGPLPTPGQMPAGSAMARIAQRGDLVVGVLEDTYPFAFRDQNLRLEGFDIDVARDIAGAIFGDRERVVFRPTLEVNRFEVVRSGQADLVVASATITCQRREQVDFSTVYFEAGQRVLVNHGSTVTGLGDLGGRRVCAARGSTSLEKVLAAPSKPVPVGAATETDCLMMLQLGQVDAVSTDDTILAGMAAQDPQTVIVGPRLTEEPYGVAIGKDAPDLLRFVNAVLERRAEDGRWRASYEHWLTPLGPPPAPPTPQYQD